jgi:hypothetical protein
MQLRAERDQARAQSQAAQETAEALHRAGRRGGAGAAQGARGLAGGPNRRARARGCVVREDQPDQRIIIENSINETSAAPAR